MRRPIDEGRPGDRRRQCCGFESGPTTCYTVAPGGAARRLLKIKKQAGFVVQLPSFGQKSKGSHMIGDVSHRNLILY